MIRKFEKHWKLLLGIGVVVFYLALLMFITATEPSNQYALSENLLSYTDFSVTAGDADVEVREDALAFTGGSAGDKVCSANISLAGIEQLFVEFTINSLEQTAGTTVHVDLCAADYDSDEQEFTVILQTGDNTISGMITPGPNASEEVQFRIFTLDPAGYDVRNLSVRNMTAVDNSVWVVVSAVVMGLGALVGMCALLGRQYGKKYYSQ